MTTHVEMLRGMLEEYDYDGFTLERAALEAAIAALAGWRPIATAPRDGTTLLLFWRNDGLCLGYRPADCPDDAATSQYGVALYPTHWMLLPPPPRGDAAMNQTA